MKLIKVFDSSLTPAGLLWVSVWYSSHLVDMDSQEGGSCWHLPFPREPDGWRPLPSYLSCPWTCLLLTLQASAPLLAAADRARPTARVRPAPYLWLQCSRNPSPAHLIKMMPRYSSTHTAVSSARLPRASLNFPNSPPNHGLCFDLFLSDPPAWLFCSTQISGRMLPLHKGLPWPHITTWLPFHIALSNFIYFTYHYLKLLYIIVIRLMYVSQTRCKLLNRRASCRSLQHPQHPEQCLEPGRHLGHSCWMSEMNVAATTHFLFLGWFLESFIFIHNECASYTIPEYQTWKESYIGQKNNVHRLVQVCIQIS